MTTNLTSGSSSQLETHGLPIKELFGRWHDLRLDVRKKVFTQVAVGEDRWEWSEVGDMDFHYLMSRCGRRTIQGIIDYLALPTHRE